MVKSIINSIIGNKVCYRHLFCRQSNIVIFSFIALFLTPSLAFAQCASPTAGNGAIQYFIANNTFRICNGSNWGTIVSAGALTTCSNSGRIDYDTGEKAYKYCDGTNWQEIACTMSGASPTQNKILASDAAAGDYFGSSASISGNYAIVGAVASSSYTGSAYIFERDGGGTYRATANTSKAVIMTNLRTGFVRYV